MSKKNKRQKQDALKMNILKTFDIVGDNEDSELEEERSAPGFTADYRDKDLGGAQDRPGLPPRDSKKKLEPELFDEIPEPEPPRLRQKKTPPPPSVKPQPATEKTEEKEAEPETESAAPSGEEMGEAAKEPVPVEQESEAEKASPGSESEPGEEQAETKAPQEEKKAEEWHIPEPPQKLGSKKEEPVENDAASGTENGTENGEVSPSEDASPGKTPKEAQPAPKINEAEKPEVETVKIYREKAGQGSVPEWAQETTEIPLEKIRENMVMQNVPASEGFVVRKTEGGATIPVRVKPKKGAESAKKRAADAAAEKKPDKKIRKIDEFFGELPEERVQGWFERPVEDSTVFSADYRDGKNEKPVKAPRHTNLAPLDDEPEADEFMQEPDSSEGLLKKWNAGGHPVTGSASVADLVQGRRRKTGKHRYGVVVGSIVLLFALVGVVFIAGSIGSRVYRFATDDSELRAYDTFLTPVVMQDPAAFEDVSKADESMVLISSMWKTVTDNNGTNYTEYDETGRVVVPLGDVVNTARELFGPDCQLQPKTPEGGSFFEYDSEENKFHVARYSSDSTYTPYTESERKRGDTITLHVGYVSPSDDWRAQDGQSAKPSPTKYMDYVLKKNPSTGALYISSIQTPAGQVAAESASK